MIRNCMGGKLLQPGLDGLDDRRPAAGGDG
jgi:hypothetical protein